eukprot:GHVQ01025066.1.p1 GENE.GHVQ01025066.1~~GHVQ01025066.1.p1  ORF type:complete len:715 (+),score=96.00 GHVQ01025066.1:1137-3281(+)
MKVTVVSPSCDSKEVTSENQQICNDINRVSKHIRFDQTGCGTSSVSSNALQVSSSTTSSTSTNASTLLLPSRISNASPPIPFLERSASQSYAVHENLTRLSQNLQTQTAVIRRLAASQLSSDRQLQTQHHQHHFFNRTIQSLRSDISQLLITLHDFVELPDDSVSPGSEGGGWRDQWSAVIQSFELKLMGAGGRATRGRGGAGEDMVLDGGSGDAEGTRLEKVCELVNVKDYLCGVVIEAALYQKAVLDFDIGIRREYCNFGMKRAWNQLSSYRTKGMVIPAKLMRLPNTAEVNGQQPASTEGDSIARKIDAVSPDTASADKAGIEDADDNFGTAGLGEQKSKLRSHRSDHTGKDVGQQLPGSACLLLELAKELGSVDVVCRNLYMGNGGGSASIPYFKDHIHEHNRRDGRDHAEEQRHSYNAVAPTSSSGDLRKEHADLWKQFCRLQNDLQAIKASKHTPHAEVLQNLQQSYNNEKQKNERLLREKNSLDARLQQLQTEKHELTNKLKELLEKINKTSNAPKLEKLEEALCRTQSHIALLKADSELLCNMYRIHVQQYENAHEQHKETETNVKHLNGQLRQQQDQNSFLKEELHKKELLVLRTMAARQAACAAYTESKCQVTQAITSEQKAHSEVELTKRVLAGRDKQLDSYKVELERAWTRVDELEQQTKFLMERCTGAGGQSRALAGFKFVPTIHSTLEGKANVHDIHSDE